MDAITGAIDSVAYVDGKNEHSSHFLEKTVFTWLQSTISWKTLHLAHSKSPPSKITLQPLSCLDITMQRGCNILISYMVLDSENAISRLVNFAHICEQLFKAKFQAIFLDRC